MLLGLTFQMARLVIQNELRVALDRDGPSRRISSSTRVCTRLAV